MHTMYEILEIEESISSHTIVKDETSRENMRNPIIFIDNALDPCDDLIYRSTSGCDLIEGGIGDSIEDSLLDVNDRLTYFHSDSANQLEQNTNSFENHDLLVTPKSNTSNQVIVEEIAEEEVISELPDQSDLKLEDMASKRKSQNIFVSTGLNSTLPSINQFPHRLKEEFECYICSKLFRRKKNLECHIRSHSSSIELHELNYSQTLSKSEIVSYLRREKIFSSKYRSMSDPKLVCELHGLSERTSRENDDMKDHKALKYKCLYCDRTFFSHVSATEHMRMEHGVHYDGFMCLYCGKQCKDFRGLQKHSKVHVDGELLLCNTCGKQFYAKNRLKRHMLSHRDKVVICEECGEETTDHRALANHRSSHHVTSLRCGILSTRTFPCYACDKVFGSRSSQQIHTRIHTGERPYSCKYCVKAFADGGTLRKHERIHTGEKPYVCPVCQKAFNQRVVLREHIRAHHASSNTPKGKCFKCEVCSTLCSSSQDLCSHLVKHSDDNTAKHRTGGNRPRKYKKWKQGKERNAAAATTAEGVDNRKMVVAAITDSKAADVGELDTMSVNRNHTDGGESFCILSDEEEILEDIRGEGKNDDFISRPVDEKLSEFSGTRKYDENGDGCPLLTDQIELQKWKMLRDESATTNIVKSYGDSFGYQLLIPFDDDKLPDECIAIRDSCENSSSSYSDTCLNLIEITDHHHSETIFETNHFTDYATKSRLHFALKEKCDYSFDSELYMHSGLGLGAIVELK